MTEIATHSVVVIIPATLRADANRVAWGLGLQLEEGLTFSRELVDVSGNRFYGTRWWASKQFKDVVKRLVELPFDPPPFKLTRARADEALMGIIIDERPRRDVPDGGYSHWVDVLSARGLLEVEQEAERA